jgi:phosphate starvation-inducible PhoH-like protein
LTSATAASPRDPILLQFDDNSLLPTLFGEHDQHLARIESALGVSLTSRGNRIAITGPAGAADVAKTALNALYRRLKDGLAVDNAEVDAAVRLASHLDTPDQPAFEITVRTRKRQITPRSPAQAAYLSALKVDELIFGLGPAGTGKTYLAVATAVEMMSAGHIERIILSRPAVEAGERLGFLPGDLREKVDPYLRPLYDALHDMLPAEQVMKRLESGEIEIAPLAFMRGRTLSHSFIILDEAQNTTPMQMKMFLTRIGEGSRMAVTGDPSQIDLPDGVGSGLHEAVGLLEGIEGVATIRFTDADVVRHPLVTRIVRAYDRADERRAAKARKQ